MPRPRPQILLSFDLEEFDVPEEYGQSIAPAERLRVGLEGLDALLRMLDRQQIPATFFVTAYFAENFPDRIQALAARNYEIASHGFYHDSFTVADLAESRVVLRRISGQPVTGFRMARLQPLAEAAIAAAGYHYNSSMNPTYLPGRYNNLGRPRLAYRSAELLNIPVSVTPLIRFPLFWLSFKHLPLWLYKLLSAWTLSHDRAINLYFHPWEFAAIGHYQLPRYIRQPCGGALLARLEQYLQWLQHRGDFVTFADFAQQQR